MIESAVAKLTFAYLAIIMVLSFGFSLLVYRVADVALDNSLRQPHQTVFRETSLYNFDDFRKDRLRVAKQDVRKSLYILNIITFATGFAVSYALARRTLSPIDRALTAQKRFASDASHELRTPLAALQSEIEVALRDKKLTLKQAREQLESNLEEVQKMQRLSNDLLQLARQENRASSTQRKQKILPIILDAVELVEKQANARNIQIDLPSTSLEAKIDAEALRTILKTFLDNAIKYSPKNSTVTIKVQEGRRSKISVIDRGIGIDQKDIPFVFERFFRADKARSSNGTEGHGLGLSIAKKVADAHSWKLSVESEPKKGSTFSVSFG